MARTGDRQSGVAASDPGVIVRSPLARWEEDECSASSVSVWCSRKFYGEPSSNNWTGSSRVLLQNEVS